MQRDVELDLDELLGVDTAAEVVPANTRPDPRRHKVVCKHWLRGLCKKGDSCDFLHRLDHNRMPECWYFSNFGECPNKECIFLHLRPEDKTTECPWYARGFCKHGQRCRHRHTRKKPCPRYLAGVCPDGPNCAFGHAKWEVRARRAMRVCARARVRRCLPARLPAAVCARAFARHRVCLLTRPLCARARRSCHQSAAAWRRCALCPARARRARPALAPTWATASAT